MSRETPHWSADPKASGRNDATGLKFAVVVARFNSAITEKLLEGARQALTEAGADGVEVFHVPGAFELPLAAKWLAHGGYSAIIA
jgi:6,7-dimethyl-8-ribityllumazine synthase